MIAQEKFCSVTREGVALQVLKSNPSLFGLSYDESSPTRLSVPTEGQMNKALQDADIFIERQQKIIERTSISEGDYVLTQNGNLTRVTVAGHSGGVQVGGYYGGSYYLNSNGYCSYSGGCGDFVDKEKLVLTEMLNSGKCWIFSGGSSGAHRGVVAVLLFRVWLLKG